MSSPALVLNAAGPSPAPANDQAPSAVAGNSPAPRKPRLDWAAIARALGQGQSAERVALDLGIQPRVVRRQVKRSAKLRRLIGHFRAETEAEAAARITGLRGKVAERLDAMLAAGNPRVTLWLADRLKLTDADSLSRLPGAAETDLMRRAEKRAHLRAINRDLAKFSPDAASTSTQFNALGTDAEPKPGTPGTL